MRATVCVFLLQLGAPVDIAAIEPFLRNLLEDVLPVPSWLRRFVARRIARASSPPRGNPPRHRLQRAPHLRQ